VGPLLKEIPLDALVFELQDIAVGKENNVLPPVKENIQLWLRV
jgi:hypothetical protein